MYDKFSKFFLFLSFIRTRREALVRKRTLTGSRFTFRGRVENFILFTRELFSKTSGVISRCVCSNERRHRFGRKVPWLLRRRKRAQDGDFRRLSLEPPWPNCFCSSASKLAASSTAASAVCARVASASNHRRGNVRQLDQPLRLALGVVDAVKDAPGAL